MKKLIALVMVCVMCLLLTGCGSQSTENEKYKDLIDMLENEDYEGAIKEIEEMSEAGRVDNSDNDAVSDAEGELKSVEITLDNWEEYFELCVHADIRENGFGEFSEALISYALVSKENLLVDWDKSDVTVEYTGTVEKRPVTVDFENRKIMYGEPTETYVSESSVSTMCSLGIYLEKSGLCRYGVYLSNSDYIDSLEGYVRSYVSDVDVSRIKGTLYYTIDN